MKATHSLPATPEEFRQRYFELQRAAQANAKRRPVAEDDGSGAMLVAAELTILDETVPGGWYWSARVERGRTLRIVNETARSSVSALFWNADDTSERYNAGDTVKVQWSAALGKGRLLFSDMGRVLMSITEDTSGGHDALLGGSTAATNLRKYGQHDLRNSRDNLVLAAAKHDLDRRDIPPCITFFAPVRTTDDGRFSWHNETTKPGAFVDLRAEMNVLVALSNCPHPLDPSPSWTAAPVRAIVWRSPVPGQHDLCRTRTDEAVRGFDNTDTLFRT